MFVVMFYLMLSVGKRGKDSWGRRVGFGCVVGLRGVIFAVSLLGGGILFFILFFLFLFCDLSGGKEDIRL